jgi:hypothetical protein
MANYRERMSARELTVWLLLAIGVILGCLFLGCENPTAPADGGLDVGRATQNREADATAPADVSMFRELGADMSGEGGSVDACPPICEAKDPSGCCICPWGPLDRGCCEDTYPPTVNHHTCCGVPCP